MILTKAEQNKIYLVNEDIKQNGETLTKGTPVLFIKTTTDDEYIFEDYRGVKWHLTEDEFSDDSVSKIPTRRNIRYRKFRRIIFDIGPILAITMFSIYFSSVAIMGILTALDIYNIVNLGIKDIPITKNFFLIIVIALISFFAGLFILAQGNQCSSVKDALCYSKENIKELKILLQRSDCQTER